MARQPIGGSTQTKGSTSGITPLAYLNKMVRGKIDGVAWDDAEADTFLQVIIEWNLTSKAVREWMQGTYTDNGYEYEDNDAPTPLVELCDPPFEWEQDDETHVFPKSWPPHLEVNDLLNSLNDGNLKLFTAFKNKLKLHKNYAGRYYWFDKFYDSGGAYSDKITSTNGFKYTVPDVYSGFGYDRQNFINHQNALFNHMQTLWDEFGAAAVDNANEDALNKFLEDHPGIQTLGDNPPSIIIEEPSITITTAVADGANWIYFVPQATDVHSVLSGRFNPPPHLSTKRFSPTAFPQKTVKNNLTALDRTTVIGTVGKNNAYNQNLIANRLGFIYQDALNPNKVATDYGISTNMNQLWGFQFMYNPTSFSYQQSSDPQLDWTGFGGSQGDISNILFGQGTASFTLYINRIVDMSVLPNVFNSSNFSGTAAGYGRTLSEDDVVGILTRGTEYDIEFLYRVLNGDPKKSPVMKNGQKTADYGIIMGMPVWLRIHDNMRWKVVVSGLSVNHVMFTPEMVPMLSEVTISVTRIPVITFDADLDKQFYDTATTTTNSDNTQN